MKILRIQDCQVRENPNYKKMDEGKEFVSVVFETDQGARVYVDLSYTASGNVKMQVSPVPEKDVKAYEKTIEIALSDGTTVVDRLKRHD